MKKGIRKRLCSILCLLMLLFDIENNSFVVLADTQQTNSIEDDDVILEESEEKLDEELDEALAEEVDEEPNEETDEEDEENLEESEDSNGETTVTLNLDEDIEAISDEELLLAELNAENEEEPKEKPHRLKKCTDGVDAITHATQSKFSSTLNFQSAKSYGGLYEDKFESAAYLIPEEGEEEGAFVAVGYTFGASDDPNWDFQQNMDAYPRVGHSYNEAIIVCFDKNHAVDWVWESKLVGVSYFKAVDVIADGSIVAVGRARDYESNRVALYMVKINPDNPDDYTEYMINSTSGGSEINGIVSTDDGGFAIAGYTAFQNGYIASRKAGETNFTGKTQIWQNADGEDEELAKRVSVKNFNGFLLKFEENMDLEFASFENYGIMENVVDPSYSSPNHKIWALDIDDDGNFVTVGQTALSKGNSNAVISKWDGLTGELLGHRMAGTSDPLKQNSIDLITAEFLSVAALSDGSYVAVGTATNDATTSEGWKTYGSKDVVVVRYSNDLESVQYSRNIGTVDGLAGSLTATSGIQMEGVVATHDGGYVLFGTENTKVVESDLVEAGYNWDNYGGNDGVIIKCNSENQVSWCQNYGTTGGDWIYDVICRENETEVTAVGQSSGQYGTPSWSWHGQAASSTNPYDAFIMTTNMYSAAYTESKASNDLSGVTWANGTYTGEGVGRGGTMTFNVIIENNSISSIECTSHNETTEGGESSPYVRASALYDTIVDQQTTEVDAISGATLTSSGIKSGVKDALAKASAQTTVAAIDKIAGYTSDSVNNTGNVNNVLAAINDYTSLTDYEREYVTNSDTLYNVAEIFGFEIVIENSGESSSGSDENQVNTAYNDTYWNMQSKYYDSINAEEFLAHNFTGEGVKIAVVDSGLIGNSADLNYDNILPGWDYTINQPMNDTNSENSISLVDTQGHGTFVTGIIAATQNNNKGITGLLSDVQIVPLRIDSGATEEASKAAAVAIVDAVDKYDCDVITTSVSLLDTEELQAAVAYADQQGVIVIGASGNSGVIDSTEDAYVYPASYDSVISVGATDANGKVRVNSTKNDQVYVTAPGQQIISLGLSAKGYRCYVKSGTSYSSPIVAAMAAAAKQKNPNMTPDDFKELLQSTCQDKGNEGYDNSYGYGLVDLAAFAEAIDPTIEEPTTDEPTNENNISSDDNTDISSTGLTNEETGNVISDSASNSTDTHNQASGSSSESVETSESSSTEINSSSTENTTTENTDSISTSNNAVSSAANSGKVESASTSENVSDSSKEKNDNNTKIKDNSIEATAKIPEKNKTLPIIPIGVGCVIIFVGVPGFIYRKSIYGILSKILKK